MGGAGGTVALTFKTDIYPSVEASCKSCHGTNDFKSVNDAYTYLTSTTTKCSTYNGKKRVVATKPEDSLF